MKRVASITAVLLLAAAGCQQAPSKLDKAVTDTPMASGGAASGDLEARVARLEANWNKHAEALDFLGKVYDQQKQQQKQQERETHDPNAVFAVNIEQNVRLGLVEGKNDAAVTIVEAWDFA